MGRFFEAMKAGVRGFKEGTKPSAYSIAGRRIQCPHCGEGLFAPGSALLNTRVRSAFNVDWADPSATILVCAECGRIEWFVQEPDPVGQ
jgi:hypothetical protein